MFNLFFIIHFLVFSFGSLGILINKEKKVYKILTIILASFSMVRFDVGYDYFWYWIIGDTTQKNHPILEKIFSELEFGIQKIYEIVRFLGHPQYFFIITGGITFYFIYKGIYTYSLSPILSLILFIKISSGFFEANNIVMQYLAVAIIFYYTKLIIEGKLIKFIIIVLLCSYLFHSSAIVTLICLFIPKKKIRIDILLIGNLIVYLNLKVILPTIVKVILPQYYYLFDYGNDRFSNMGNIKYQLSIILFYLIVTNFKKSKIIKNIFKKKQISILENYYANLFIIGTLLALDLEYIFPGDLSRRVGNYFIMYGFVLFGNTFYLFSDNFSKYLKIIFLIMLSLLNIRSSLKFEGIYLDKKPYYDKKENLISRPNSSGFKIFINKKYEDMSPYLPGEYKFEKINNRNN
ncbi:MAG: EpsG family protein [Fusobacteriaceae bacterium]